MNFISAEEFLKQNKNTQNTILKWWRNHSNKYDLVTSPTVNFKVYILEQWGVMYTCIPLLTEGQLRQFIEDKTNAVVKVIQWHIEDNDISNRGYSMEIDLLKKDEYKVTKCFKNLGNDLLQAYWKVTCQIAKEVQNDN